MSDETPKPRFCKVCIDTKVERPMVRAPGYSYCKVHRREYQKQYRDKRKLEQELALQTHNEYGEPINEYGMTPDEMKAYMESEAKRIDETYGPSTM